MSALLAALAAGVATAALVTPGASALGRLHARPAEDETARGRRRPWWLVCVLVVSGAGLVGGGSALAGSLAGAIVVVTLGWLAGRQRARVRSARRRGEVAEAARSLAGLLRVGVVPATALAQADDHPPLREARAAQATGGDVAAALRRSAETPGYEGLADLAGAWTLAQRTGASLVLALESVASALAETEAATSAVAVELAAPRAGGRVLGVLPLVGLGLGYVLGGDPIDFLLHTPFGWFCLVAGVGLACVGLWWSDVIAEPPGGK